MKRDRFRNVTVRPKDLKRRFIQARCFPFMANPQEHRNRSKRTPTSSIVMFSPQPYTRGPEFFLPDGFFPDGIPTAGMPIPKTALALSGETSRESLFGATQLLLVDRDRSSVDHLEAHLKTAGIHQIHSCFDADQAAHVIDSLLCSPDIVVTDISCGFELLRSIRKQPSLAAAGIILLAERFEPEEKLAALHLGASAFLTKPVNCNELVLSIRNMVSSKAYHDHLSYQSSRLETEVRRRTHQLEAAHQQAQWARQQALHCLARAAEFRDDDTGNHVMRVGQYAAIIARRFQLNRHQRMQLEQAAQLHDVGKIGISDTILLKPGKLTKREFELMKRHCEYGSNIILPMSDHEWTELMQNPGNTFQITEPCGSPVMKLAALIARTHHERWDGSGYPHGLQGKDIPMVGRITAIADVFDALCSERPYKQAFEIEQCFQIIRQGSGTHFDPEVVEAFFDAEPELLKVKQRLTD